MRTLSWVIWGVATAVAVAWLVEAFTVGRGFVSTYLAPISFCGTLLSLYLRNRAGDRAAR